MFTFLSLVTSIKDYVEVVHKLIETDANFSFMSYYDFGSVFTFTVLTGKEIIKNFLSFQWFQNVWSIPTVVPDVASSLISEISVFDGSFKNTQSFFETPFSYGNQNFFIYCVEKFMIGFLNSIFLCFPSSISHVITLRRFVMQGLEAGFLSGLGTIVGNIVWIASIVFGLRFVVIPWLSLDLFRYFLGFLLIVKYMWDSSRERRMVLEDFSKYKIFFLTFLLSFTEQTTIYPFISNLSFGSDATILESFPTENFSQFAFVHCCYLLGLLVGSLSLLQFTCWFWENPAFQIYMWFLSSFQITKTISSKFINFIFLYLTMICAISNFSYFGLDYTLTNPLGFVHEDRLFEQKAFLETAFLNTKASDRNTRRNRGRHGRRERWKRRVRRYRTFDASMYDQGIYDLFTIEDLNYGFDRFWLRRKIRNHRVRFRFFPGPWMRSFKKQLSRPRLESFLGPRVEFFRILFEQAYHPEFHEFSSSGNAKQSNQRMKKNLLKTKNQAQMLSPFLRSSPVDETLKKENAMDFENFGNQNFISWNLQKNKKQRILKEHSTYRKFVRKIQTRVKRAKIEYELQNPRNFHLSIENSQNLTKPISSKIWKNFTGNEKRNFPSQKTFSNDIAKSSISPKSEENFLFERFYKKLFLKNFKNKSSPLLQTLESFSRGADQKLLNETGKTDLKKHLSKKDLFVQRYKMFLYSQNNSSNMISNSNILKKNQLFLFSPPRSGQSGPNDSNFGVLSSQSEEFPISSTEKTQKQKVQNEQKNLVPQSGSQFLRNASQYRAMTLLHPLQFYFQKEQALKRKFQFYGVKLFRNFGVEKNAPYFRVFMKRFFYHYKPSLRWERTLRVATYRRARRKTSRIPRKFNVPKSSQILAQFQPINGSLYSGEDFNSLNAMKNKIASESGDSKNNQKTLQTIESQQFDFPNGFKPSGITDPTHFYSLVDKRASRYRFQIYKDVLQHWYYSPLNRLLLKLDIDSFIRRQPNSYFLTKNDEKFLHLKRQLLFEYYETLRWYTSMEQYRTMKNQIGGTKSLSNRAYNQQFAGTFKKIRHLFNISPSFRESTVLKFDQPLYNEYKKSEKGSVFNDSVLHEEFFGSGQQTFNSFTLSNTNGFPNRSTSAGGMQAGTNPENLVNQSISILRDYLSTAAPIRQQYIENLLKEKNYWELTQFFFRGQKIRGSQPITNETDFLNQEKESLFPRGADKNNSLNTSFYAPAVAEAQQYNSYAFKDEIWIALLKKCQKKLYDQEALKNYVSLKKEKYEIQKQRHEKYLKNRFQRIQESILENSEILSSSSAQKKQKNGFPTLSNSEKKKIENFENFSGYPSSFKKAVKESILWEKNSIASSSFQTIDKLFGADRFANRGKKLFLEKTNIRQNQFPMYSSFEKENLQNRKSLVREAGISGLSHRGADQNSPTNINSSKQRSIVFTKNLRFSVKKKALQILQAEKNVQEKFEPFPQSGLKKSRSFSLPKIFLSTFEKTKTILWNVFRFQNIFGFQENSNQNLQNFSSQNQRKFSFLFSRKKSNLFDPTEGKNFRFVDEFWKKRENILAKKKKLRKTFKRLRNQKTPTEKIFFENSDFFMPLAEHKNLSTENRQKIENFHSGANLDFLKKQKSTRSRLWKKYLGKAASDQQENTQKNMFSFLSGNGFFRGAGSGFGSHSGKKFQRKRSRLRRYSSFKGRGPIKKRTLREKLKRQFKSLKKYGRNQMVASSREADQIAKEREKKKVELIQYITQRKYEADGKFLKRNEKQRRTRQTKHRAWKKKKQNFAQKRRKLRKRRRSTTSKIRVLNKKISRILSRKEIQTWWWKTFFPHFQKTAEKTWQLQKNMQIRKQLFELSEKEIFERDQKNRIGNISSLQIGDKDFKPFAIPEALRIRDKLVQQNVLHFDNLFQPSVEKKENFDFRSFIPSGSALDVESRGDQKSKAEKIQTSTQVEQKETNLSMLQNKTGKSFEFYKSGQIFDEVNNLILNEERKTEKFSNSPFFVPTNPLPFYAGWDESLRKFIITNRFLSRKECFSCSLKENKTFFGSQAENQQKQREPLFSPILPLPQSGWSREAVGEEQSPLKGMNAATTLYWQIPFTTYDPDQFFALGMDGFSPIGWRNFSLNHSKQTTKPILVKNFLSFEQNKQNFSKNLQYKIFQQNFSKKNFFVQHQKNEIEKNFEYRRVLKKQKRLKKHPRPPVWFPSGSLSQQVLPVHYIYVFYKRSRLPRDRYIRRRLRSTFLKNQNSNSSQNGENSFFVDRTRMVDFTLRKRTKPRRKYHRKRFGNISRGTDEKNEFFARRRKFRGFENETETTRPSSKIFQTSSLAGAKQEKRILRMQSKQGGSIQTKQRRKIQDSKQQTENLRVRQLRRRVQRQVYRPIWRSRPRAGGFVWPGDYLRLELVKASPLKTTNLSSPFAEGDETGQSVARNAPKENETISQQSSSRKIRKKTRRTLQEWQIQPKRYLFEKHNLKVLKTRLEKSLNFN